MLPIVKVLPANPEENKVAQLTERVLSMLNPCSDPRVPGCVCVWYTRATTYNRTDTELRALKRALKGLEELGVMYHIPPDRNCCKKGQWLFSPACVYFKSARTYKDLIKVYDRFVYEKPVEDYYRAMVEKIRLLCWAEVENTENPNKTVVKLLEVLNEWDGSDVLDRDGVRLPVHDEVEGVPMIILSEDAVDGDELPWNKEANDGQ